MKVGPISSGAQVNPYADTTRAAAKSHAGFQETDKLELGESTRQLQGLMEAARDVPEVRMDKVNAIKSQIEAGTYKVDGRAIAEKILGQLER